VQVATRAECKREKWNHHGQGTRKEVAHFAIQVAEQHADRERQNTADNPIFAANSGPPFFIIYGVALTLMLAPIHT